MATSTAVVLSIVNEMCANERDDPWAGPTVQVSIRILAKKAIVQSNRSSRLGRKWKRPGDFITNRPKKGRCWSFVRSEFGRLFLHIIVTIAFLASIYSDSAVRIVWVAETLRQSVDDDNEIESRDFNRAGLSQSSQPTFWTMGHSRTRGFCRQLVFFVHQSHSFVSFSAVSFRRPTTDNSTRQTRPFLFFWASRERERERKASSRIIHRLGPVDRDSLDQSKQDGPHYQHLTRTDVADFY